MKYGVQFILIIFVLFVAACNESTEKAVTEDPPNKNQVTRVFASTYLGGNGHEFCEALALDSEGNIYVAGNTRSLDFPTTEGVYNRTPKGKSDVFVAKFDNDLQTLLAATLIGGGEEECAYTLLFDKRGYIYVAGYTSSEDFPTTPQSYDTNYNGGNGDAFILKMDKDLQTLVSSTYLGGSDAEDDWRSPELVQDEDGNVFLAGNTASDDFPSTSGVFQEKYNGGARDVFLVKFDSDLEQLVASTFLGGSGDESLGRSLSIDFKKNEIIIAGYTFSPDFPTSQSAYGRVISGNLDGFVSKFDLDLKALTASTILDSGWIYCLMIHDNGDIYVGGHAGTRLTTTSSAFYQSFDKALDQGFISCLSNDLSELKSSTVVPGSYATGGGRICSLSLCQSSDGHVLSAGWVRPIDFPITPGVYDETQNGNGDTYIMKMDRDLSEVLLSTFIGGGRSERWNRMETDGKGEIYLAGYTLSSDFPTTPNAAFQKFTDVISDEEENLNTSPREAFIIKIGEDLSAEVFEEFHDAAKRNRVDKLRELLSVDKNRLEKRDRYQRTPLHSAARYGASSAARFLLSRRAEVEVKDESGNTPLHLSSIYRHHEIVDLLIRKGADFDIPNDQGYTPLYVASMFGNPESLKFLLANGAKTNISDAEGNTPLHIAAYYRKAENLEAILKVNPDIDMINTEGDSPLLLAVQRPDNEMAVELLLQAGADVNITDSEGRNALLVCVDSSQKDYIGPLVSMGIDIDSRDNEGNTALHYIFKKVLANKLYIPMCKEIARPLVEGGADSSIRNKEGKSPADLAEESGEDELIDLLNSTARKKESR